MSDIYKGILATIIIVLLIPIVAICFKEMNNNMGVANATLWRFILGFIIIVPFLKTKDNLKIKSKEDIKFLLLRGILVGSAVGFYFISLHNLDLSIALIISQIYPLFIPILGYIFLKEKSSLISILLLIISFIGVYLISTKDNMQINNDDFIFIIIGLISTLFSAIIIILNRNLSQRYDTKFLLFNFVVGGLIFSFIWCIYEGFVFPDNITIFSIILLTAFLSNFQQKMLLIKTKYLKSDSIANLSYLNIPVFLIFGYVFYNETINIYQATGVFIIMLSTITHLYFLVKK